MESTTFLLSRNPQDPDVEPYRAKYQSEEPQGGWIPGWVIWAQFPGHAPQLCQVWECTYPSDPVPYRLVPLRVQPLIQA